MEREGEGEKRAFPLFAGLGLLDLALVRLSGFGLLLPLATGPS